MADMQRWIIHYVKTPTNYNVHRNAVVEAQSAEDATAILLDRLGEGNGVQEYVVDPPRPYQPPPPGRIISLHESLDSG